MNNASVTPEPKAFSAKRSSKTSVAKPPTGIWKRLTNWAKGVNKKLHKKPTRPTSRKKNTKSALLGSAAPANLTSEFYAAPEMTFFSANLSFSAPKANTQTLPTLAAEPESEFGAPQNSMSLSLLKAPLPQTQLSQGLSQFTAWNEEFFAYVDSFLREQTSIHTRRAYEQDLIHFLGYLKSADLPMNVHTLVKYRSTLEERLSARTGKPLTHISINRKLACIKSFLNFLVLNGVMPNNPAKAVKSFRAGRESPTRDIPDDAVRRMLDLPNRHNKTGALHHLILTILFHMGLRRAELTGLRTSDLFEEAGIPVIRVRGKGDRERVLPLPQSVQDSLKHYFRLTGKSQNTDEFLLTPVKNNVTKELNKELNPNSIAYIVKRYAKRAGIEYRVSPHSARATAVSNALDHLAPHRSIQHMAGWTSPLMVARYDKRRSDLRNSGIHFITYD